MVALPSEAPKTKDCSNLSQGLGKTPRLLNVGKRSVVRAKTIHREAVPEIVKAVEKGNVRVSAAAPFAKQPREKQAKQIRNANTPADAVKTHCRDLSTSSGKPNR